MATTKVTTKKVTLRTEALKRVAAAYPGVQRQLEDQFRKFTGRQMVNIVTEHYQEAINQAARLADQGVPGAESGASPVVNTRFGSVAMGLWTALTDRYRKNKRRQRPGTESLFWKFRGDTGRYLIKLAIGVRSASLSRVKAELSSSRAKATIRISSTITAPSTGDPVIDGLMRNSFVQGAPTFVQGEGGGKTLTPAGIVAVTEARRPLISQLAAALGNKAVQALRKIKQ